ncbi:succinate dehydrogenase/fumarate reductase flavoprotein subunit, partial [bacterium]|nr:succinate dehydrogenase/fumarate reductase flavoprotein subunit [bacterium]
AGPSAARYAAGAADPEPDPAQAEALKAEIYAPLKRHEGMTTHEMVWRIRNVMQPIKYTGWKKEERLKEALGIVLGLSAKLPTLVAKDAHDLSAANECRSMLLASEMFFRAALERKESRGWFLREDYAERDDRNYLKWIFLKRNGDGMELTSEPVPMERYRYQPEGWTA